MEQYVKQIDDTLNNALNNYVRKPTLVRGVVQLLLILYAARLAPSLPKPVFQLFENAYFKLFIFSLVLWTAQFSPSTSILIALAFMVTTNYANQQPLWEFIENVEAGDPTQAPMAPSKEIAVDAAIAVVENQSANTPVVANIAQKQETIVIQPTIVDTPQGPAVVNPTVVVAQAVVSGPDGEKIIVKPDVTVVEAPAMTAQPAPSQEAAPVPVPVPAPAPAPAAPKTVAAEPAQTPQAQAGCYPIRRYDMAKITAFEGHNSYGSL